MTVFPCLAHCAAPCAVLSALTGTGALSRSKRSSDIGHATAGNLPDMASQP